MLLRQDSNHEVIMNTPTVEMTAMFINWGSLGGSQGSVRRSITGEPCGNDQQSQIFEEKPG